MEKILENNTGGNPKTAREKNGETSSARRNGYEIFKTTKATPCQYRLLVPLPLGVPMIRSFRYFSSKLFSKEVYFNVSRQVCLLL
jgi:hypothetical protein